MDLRRMVEGSEQREDGSSRASLIGWVMRPRTRQTLMWAALVALVAPLVAAVALLAWSVVEARELIQSGQWVPDNENPGLDPVNLVIFAVVACVALFAVIACAGTIRGGGGTGVSRTWGLTWLCTVILFGVAIATEANVCLGRVPCVSSLGTPTVSFELVNLLMLWIVAVSFVGWLGMIALYHWQQGWFQ